MLMDPHGWTIFCDDIRQEIGGKVSFMGVYRGSLIIHSPFPATLPKFGMAIHYRIGSDDTRLEDVKLNIYFPGDDDDNPSVQAGIPVSQAVSQSDAGKGTFHEFVANVVLGPVTFKEEGKIKIRAIGPAGKVRLGTLKIEQKLPKGDAAAG